jgi:hypothetical protein
MGKCHATLHMVWHGAMPAQALFDEAKSGGLFQPLDQALD